MHPPYPDWAVPPEPKKRKPLRLVKLHNTTAAAQKLMAKNVAQSPLLRLSPELRNRVYKYVFGGHHIHIAWRKIPWPGENCVHNICKALQPASVRAEGAFTLPRSSRQVGPPHAGCRMDLEAQGRKLVKGHCAQLPLTLGLLQVCRQIHQEAALLPFVHNAFLFEWVYHLPRFANQLIVSQRSAVTALILDVTDCAYRTYRWTKTDKPRLSRLKGIKTLTLVVEVTVRKPGLVPKPEVERLPDLSHCLEDLFAWTPSASVTVQIARVVDEEVARDLLADAVPVPVAYFAWAREAEQALLARWSTWRGAEGRAWERESRRRFTLIAERGYA